MLTVAISVGALADRRELPLEIEPEAVEAPQLVCSRFAESSGEWRCKSSMRTIE